MKKTIGNITIEIKGTLITFVDATTREMIKAVDSNPVEALGKYHQYVKDLEAREAKLNSAKA
tara:strand:- start:417 stop:602 length:186 start_codon:yes stop_codon:yes gene_type:complete